ncbi:hypothetical protein CDAR_468471 [Caerostris darwini]|uniref:Uncharacterized protein n=1 Tax=Caerostris darwini TaxID=1538125 RepID=A0AAV4Q2P7_9ARAC|nr:hypothetical protein CDAR_468471 [Caerostris darwini]
MFSRVLNINLYFPPSLVSCAFREFARKGILTTNDPFLCSTPAKPLAQRYRRRTSHCSLIIRDSSLGELITEQLEHPRVCLPTPVPSRSLVAQGRRAAVWLEKVQACKGFSRGG